MTSQTYSLTKIAVVFVAVAMVVSSLFALSAQRAQAQLSLADLIELFIALDIIPADKADEARAVLANQQGGSATAACAFTFTRNLSVGDTGTDVMELQKFLNANGFTVAQSGPGSPGNETTYYGSLTADAVKRFQEAYASDILAPLGLTAGTGYFGASTRAKVNELCAEKEEAPATMPETPSTPDEEEQQPADQGDTAALSGGEASLENFDVLSDPSDEDLQEGDNDAAVMAFEFDVEDGDAAVRRVDVQFQGMANANCSQGNQVCEDKPWRSFDSVSLWRDGEKIAEEDANSESDWSDQGSDVYRMRFTGLDEVFQEGDTAKFTVAVDVSDSIDNSDLDQTWKVWVPASGVRAMDGAGIDQYTGSDTQYETFNVESISSNTEMKLSTNSSNPDASTIRVDENNKTDDVTVLVFDVEAQDGAITLNDIVIFATTSTSALNTLFSDFTLEIDGKQFSDWRYDEDKNLSTQTSADSDGDTQSAWIHFPLEDNDDEFTIAKDDKVTVKLMVDFKKLNANGDTVEFDVTGTERNAWDVDDAQGDMLATSKRSGTANGEEHALLTEGIFAEIVSTDASVRTISNGTQDVADFEIVFDVTAFDNTFYVASTVANALVYHIERNNVSIGTASTTASSLTSTAPEESTGNWRVDDGSTETFTFTVTVNPDLTGSYRAVLDQVKYSKSNTGTVNDLSHQVRPVEDFRTNTVTISQ